MNEVEILIISSLSDFTTDYVCIELNKRQSKYLRLNRDQFDSYSIDFNIDDLELRIKIEDMWYLVKDSNLKSVYYRAPIYLHYIPRGELSFEEQLYRSQWMAFIRNLTLFENAKWMNNPFATFKSENKMLQLKYARQCGLICPSTHLVNNVSDINLDIKNTYAVKSLDTVILRRDTKEAFSYTNIISGRDILNSDLRMAPVVIQDNINPKIDIRVTVVGDTIFPVKIVSSNDENGISGDWRKQKDQVKFIPIKLPSSIMQSCISLTNKLGLSFGGIDLAYSLNEYFFIEINPTGEWAWLVDSAGQRIDEAICEYLCQEVIL